jgi:hypothetical protein
VKRRRRWTASSLAKQYRDCLDAGDRACARDAAERIQRSSSPTAQKVVSSARSHGLLGLRGGKRGLRGTPAQHEATAADYAQTARHLLLEAYQAEEGSAKAATSLKRARDAALQAHTECYWLRGSHPSSGTCEDNHAVLNQIAREQVRRCGLSGAKKRRLGSVVIRRGGTYQKVETSTRRAASNPFRDELAVGQHEQTKCTITVLGSDYKTKSFPSTKAGFKQARAFAEGVAGAEVSLRCGGATSRMARKVDGELLVERGVSAAKKALKFRGQR